MKNIALIALIIPSALFAAHEESYALAPLTEKAEISDGLLLVWHMLDKVYEKSPKNTEIKAFLKEYRPHREALLKKSFDAKTLIAAFVLNKQQQKVGFIATHQSEEQPQAVIFDNLCPGTKATIQRVVPLLIGFVENQFPNATTYYTSTLNTEALGEPIETPQESTALNPHKELEDFGFTKTDYLDPSYGDYAPYFQGWVKTIKEGS